jgi:predicted NUDIX family NTP pyrophosphohydrolase
MLRPRHRRRMNCSISCGLPPRSRKLARSAGLLLYRGSGESLQVLLVHPGGPAWAKRDVGAWSIPKGEYELDEEPLAAARREFEEELGARAPAGPAEDLGEVRQRAGKVVRAWAVRGDFDSTSINSTTFEFEWPPRSGKMIEIPEVDRAEWLALDAAREKINPGQVPLLERLEALVGGGDR